MEGMKESVKKFLSDGSGYGDGSGDGSGYGDGSGDGSGYGSGYGDGDGDGSGYPVDLGDDLVCQYCKHYPNANTGCPGWTENDCFEWRGQKEE